MEYYTSYTDEVTTESIREITEIMVIDLHTRAAMLAGACVLLPLAIVTFCFL